MYDKYKCTYLSVVRFRSIIRKAVWESRIAKATKEENDRLAKMEK